MNVVINKTQFALKRHRDKTKAEKKQIQLKKKQIVKKNGKKTMK